MRFDAHVHFNTFNEAFLNYGIENGMRFLSIVTDMPFFILDNIDKSMNLGAVGVKVWKNIGMSLKDDKGNYVMIDHPSFEPIFQFLEDNDILLLGHNGEPKNCWLPTKDMTVESDKAYYDLLGCIWQVRNGTPTK